MLFKVLDIVLFATLLTQVLYLLLFAIASHTTPKKVAQCHSKAEPKVLTLFPAYREDGVIEDSVISFLKQRYPKELLEVVVISDSMSQQSNQLLSELPITLLITPKPLKNKANAMKFALEELKGIEYDLVVVLDADNLVESNFLNDIASAYCRGALAMQAHRRPKNSEGSIAILDGVSEEVNNSIFRLGYWNCGFSATLSGSGMAFHYPLFKELITSLESAGEDKELELLLLKKGVTIEYLDNTPLYDQKTSSSKGFYNQRRRWIASQINALKKGLKLLRPAVKNRNLDLLNKIFQHLLLPKVLLLGALIICSMFLTIISPLHSIKWWIATLLFIFTILIATPKEMLTREVLTSLFMLPAIFFMMLINLFRSRGATNNFIHTKKGEL